MAEPLPGAARDIVERVCLSFRDWAPEETRPPRVEGKLPGGQSNLSLLLRGDLGSWVLRIPRDDRPDGVDYAREARLHGLAAAHSLAPELVLAEPGTGILVTTYLAPDGEGDALMTPDEMDSEWDGRGSGGPSETPQALARLLRAIHALDAQGPAESGADQSNRPCDDRGIDRSPLDAATELERLRHGPGLTDPLADLPRETRHQLRACAERSRERPSDCVICHNDLLRSNRLTHRGRLVAIDWEYARPGDPVFDLAVVASELHPGQHGALLAAYLERPPLAREEQHLMDQLMLYAAIAVCWYARHGSASAARMAADALVAFSRPDTTPRRAR